MNTEKSLTEKKKEKFLTKIFNHIKNIFRKNKLKEKNNHIEDDIPLDYTRKNSLKNTSLQKDYYEAELIRKVKKDITVLYQMSEIELDELNSALVNRKNVLEREEKQLRNDISIMKQKISS